MTVVKIVLGVALVAFLGYQIYSLVVAIKKRKKETRDKNGPSSSGTDDSSHSS